ncbi:head outer capsid protein [Salmonella phage 35]|uniref:Head outer capsid protein n=1 Tax=Salmonella phage 35 TaxID=1654888 RepID=A0A0N7CAF3_9CAUD|nr:head outer capsid protein [Salmonella phage 35]AKJ74154.1 head outer capsid protein [Salmonella phage 35]
MDKAQRLTAARMAADRYAGIARAKGFKRHADGVTFTRADADLTWDDRARAFRVTLYKWTGPRVLPLPLYALMRCLTCC